MIGADPKMHEVEARAFRPGIYKHYKGGTYTAIGIIRHHETRFPMVLYVSHALGGLNVRPLVGWEGDADGWNDLVGDEKNYHRLRFEFVRELPSGLEAI